MCSYLLGDHNEFLPTFTNVLMGPWMVTGAGNSSREVIHGPIKGMQHSLIYIRGHLKHVTSEDINQKY